MNPDSITSKLGEDLIHFDRPYIPQTSYEIGIELVVRFMVDTFCSKVSQE